MVSFNRKMAFNGPYCLLIDFSDVHFSLTVRFRTVGPQTLIYYGPDVQKPRDIITGLRYAYSCRYLLQIRPRQSNLSRAG